MYKKVEMATVSVCLFILVASTFFGFNQLFDPKNNGSLKTPVFFCEALSLNALALRSNWKE